MENMGHTVYLHPHDDGSVEWGTTHDGTGLTFTVKTDDDDYGVDVALFATTEHMADLLAHLLGRADVADVMRRRAHEAVAAAPKAVERAWDAGHRAGDDDTDTGGGVAAQELVHVGGVTPMTRWPKCPACGHRAGLHDASRSADPRFGCRANADGDPCACPALADYASTTFISGVAGGGL